MGKDGKTKRPNATTAEEDNPLHEWFLCCVALIAAVIAFVMYTHNRAKREHILSAVE